MKTTLKTALLLMLVILALNLKAQVSINTSGLAPDGSSMLDITSTNKGVLIPRILFASRPASPINGLLIYQTDGTPGFYYYNGAAWVRLYSGSGNAWDILGNAGTSSVTNFIGTTDAVDFVMKTGVGGVERMRILSGGNVGIGTTTPTSMLSVGATSQFQINSTGAIVAMTGITSSGAITFSGLSTLGIVHNNAAGLLSTSLISLTSDITGTLPVGNGGTGATTLTGMLKGNGAAAITAVTGTQWGAAYWSDANTIGSTAAGTAKQLLISNGAAAPTWYSLGGVHETIYRGSINNGAGAARAAGENSVVGYTNSTTGLYYETGNYWSAYGVLNNYDELKMPKCVVTSIRVMLGANSTAGATQTFYIVNATTSTSTAFAPVIASGAVAGVYDLTGTATFAEGDLLAIKNVGSANAGALYIWRIDIVYYLLP